MAKLTRRNFLAASAAAATAGMLAACNGNAPAPAPAEGGDAPGVLPEEVVQWRGVSLSRSAT